MNEDFWYDDDNADDDNNNNDNNNRDNKEDNTEDDNKDRNKVKKQNNKKNIISFRIFCILLGNVSSSFDRISAFIHTLEEIKGTVTQNIFSLKGGHIGCIDL